MKSIRKIVSSIAIIVLLSGIYIPAKAERVDPFYLTIWALGAGIFLSFSYQALVQKNLPWYSRTYLLTVAGCGYFGVVNAEGIGNYLTTKFKK